MSERKIKAVNNKKDKQYTYQQMMERYKKAINEEFYFEAILISYATIEDRLRSFLYYIGAIRNRDINKLNVSKTKKQLRNIYSDFDDSAANVRIDFKYITVKINLIKKTLLWSQECIGKPEDSYLQVLKDAYEGCLDIGFMLDTLEAIEEWNEYRNEIIHGLLNKNVADLNNQIKECAINGMQYARDIDSQVKCLKKKNGIRKTCKIVD